MKNFPESEPEVENRNIGLPKFLRFHPNNLVRRIETGLLVAGLVGLNIWCAEKLLEPAIIDESSEPNINCLTGPKAGHLEYDNIGLDYSKFFVGGVPLLIERGEFADIDVDDNQNIWAGKTLLEQTPNHVKFGFDGKLLTPGGLQFDAFVIRHAKSGLDPEVIADIQIQAECLTSS